MQSEYAAVVTNKVLSVVRMLEQDSRKTTKIQRNSANQV